MCKEAAADGGSPPCFSVTCRACLPRRWPSLCASARQALVAPSWGRSARRQALRGGGEERGARRLARLLAAYHEAAAAAAPPAALLPAPAGGGPPPADAPLLIRGGAAPAASALRPAAPAQAAAAGAAAAAAAGLPAGAAALAAAGAAAAALLPPLVRPLVAAAAAAGLDLGGVVLPAVVDALVAGPLCGADGGGGGGAEGGGAAAAAARGRWRRRRTRLALDLGGLLRGLADPARVGARLEAALPALLRSVSGAAGRACGAGWQPCKGWRCPGVTRSVLCGIARSCRGPPVRGRACCWSSHAQHAVMVLCCLLGRAAGPIPPSMHFAKHAITVLCSLFGRERNQAGGATPARACARPPETTWPR